MKYSIVSLNPFKVCLLLLGAALLTSTVAPATAQPTTPEVRQPRAPREPGAARLDHGEVERRAHHLEVAIENLHAAGMHEPAERLTPQLERMRRHLSEMGPVRPVQPEVPGEAIEEIRAQLAELQRVVRQLRAEVEELRRKQR